MQAAANTDTKDTRPEPQISLLTDPDSQVLIPELAGEYPIDQIINYTETGDLDALNRRGKMRILVDMANIATLHRAATRQDLEIDQARRLANRLGLQPVALNVNSAAATFTCSRESKSSRRISNWNWYQKPWISSKYSITSPVESMTLPSQTILS